MDIDTFLKLVKGRRSIRRFKPDLVPDEYIKKILEAARWAMSGGNGQPWEFIIVGDAGSRKKIGELYLDYRKRIHALEKMRSEEFRHPSGILSEVMPGFVNAPVLIVVCGDPRTYLATVSIACLYAGEGGPNATYLKNMANACMIIHLAAASCGLGAQWLSVEDPFEKQLKDILRIPDEIEVHTIIPIGYPAYDPPAPYRRKLEEVVHYEKYDRLKLRTEDDIVEYIRHLRELTKPAYHKAKP